MAWAMIYTLNAQRFVAFRIQNTEYRLFIVYDNIEIGLSIAYTFFFTKLHVKQQHGIYIHTYIYQW